jgi:hypothetical protein
MAERDSVKNSQFMKAITDAHYIVQKDSAKIENNEPILPRTQILELVCFALKMSKNTARRTLKETAICNLPGKKRLPFQ